MNIKKKLFITIAIILGVLIIAFVVKQAISFAEIATLMQNVNDTRMNYAVYDIKTGQPIKTYIMDGKWVDKITASPDGRFCLAYSDNFLQLVDLEKGTEVWKKEYQGEKTKLARFSKDGSKIYRGLIHKLEMINPADGAIMKTIDLQPSYELIMSDDEKLLVSIADQLNVTDIDSGKTITTIDFKYSVNSFYKLSPDNKYLYALSVTDPDPATQNNILLSEIYLSDKSVKSKLDYKLTNAKVTDFNVNRLTTVWVDKSNLSVLDTRDWNEVKKLSFTSSTQKIKDAKNNPRLSAYFTPDGKYLTVTIWGYEWEKSLSPQSLPDTEVYIYDTRTWQEIKIPTKYNGLSCLTPDGSKLITSSKYSLSSYLSK